MQKKLRSWVLTGLTGLLLAACQYTPTLDATCYTCLESNPYCPDGTTCMGGYCRTPNSSCPVPDAAMEAPPDLRPASDGASPSVDMSMHGCRSGVGYVVGSAYACPGRFDADPLTAVPFASELCAPGYGIAPTSTGIDLAACKALPGFFAAQVRAYKDASGLTFFRCGEAPSGPYVKLQVGCGQTRADAITMGSKQCGGQYNQAIDCSLSTAWSCTNAPTLDQARQLGDADGVLCVMQ